MPAHVFLHLDLLYVNDDPIRANLEREPAPARGASPAPRSSRRGFLKLAGAAAATAAAASVGCAPAGDTTARATDGAARGAGLSGIDRATLNALGEVMLPASIGAAGRAAAVAAFVAWVDGYDPVAEEMHGYGYADVRYLAPDPAPAWRAQLDGLDILARKMRRKPFVELDAAAREAVVTAALATVGGAALPDPLGASHIAVALVSHWAASSPAWDLALGAKVGTGSCRTLDGVIAKPLALDGSHA